MRLADFILANVEPILLEWESFARSIWPNGVTADPAELRDEAEDILHATAVDMQSDQTDAQQAEKSKGASRAWDGGAGLTRASATHGSGRVASGFELWAVIAEYRALRASVLRLWRERGCGLPACRTAISRYKRTRRLHDALERIAEVLRDGDPGCGAGEVVCGDFDAP